MESWRIHLMPAGAHRRDPEARLYDPEARHGAIRQDEEWEVEFSADSLTDLAAARVAYEMVRLRLPPEVLRGVVGDVVITLPGGKTWSGKLRDFLGVLNGIWTAHLTPLVARVEELEKMGRAMPEDAIGEIAVILRAPGNPLPKAAD